MIKKILFNSLLGVLCFLVLLLILVTRPILIVLRWINHLKKKRVVQELNQSTPKEFGILIKHNLRESSRTYDFKLNGRQVVLIQLLNIEENSSNLPEEYVILSKEVLIDLCEHSSVDLFSNF